MQLFHRTYLSSRMSNFCTTSGNGASFRRVFSTSSQVSVEFSTSRLPNNSNTFPPNVLSQACSSLPEQAAFTESTEHSLTFIHHDCLDHMYCQKFYMHVQESSKLQVFRYCERNVIEMITTVKSLNFVGDIFHEMSNFHGNKF